MLGNNKSGKITQQVIFWYVLVYQVMKLWRFYLLMEKPIVPQSTGKVT